MADITTTAEAALWLGVSEDDPHLPRLVAVGNAAVTSHLNRDDLDDLDPMPPAIVQAALETVASMYRNRTQNPLVASMSLGDGSVSFRDLAAAGPIPPTALALLAPHRRFTIVSSA